MFNHSAHSHMISGWRKPHQSFHVIDDLLNRQGDSFTLKSPATGYGIEITFTMLKDDPYHIVVRSTNWKAEDEPNGIYKVEDCRYFYKDLVKAGFVKV